MKSLVREKPPVRAAYGVTDRRHEILIKMIVNRRPQSLDWELYCKLPGARTASTLSINDPIEKAVLAPGRALPPAYGGRPDDSRPLLTYDL